MQSVTYLAANDLTITCESGTVEYKRGDMVDFCHNESGDVWISYHEEKDGKVHAFELDITDVDLFSKLLENVIIEELELDSKVSYKEMTLDQLIIEEGIDVARLMRLMVETNYKKVVNKENSIIVPKRSMKVMRTPKQRAAAMNESIAISRDEDAIRNKVKSFKISKKSGLGESFFIDRGLLFNNDQKTIIKNVYENLKSYFGDKAKVKLKENKVSVNLFNSDEERLIEALEHLNVNYLLEGSDDYKFVSVYKPQARTVVESYYSEAEDGEKDDEEDDEEDKDYMEMCGAHYKEMKAKMKAMEESDDEVDMDKAKELLDKYKEKMDKMKEMDDKDKEKLFKEMEGDYHKFIKMMETDDSEEDEIEEKKKK